MRPRTTATTWVTFPMGLTPALAAPLITRGWLPRVGFACGIPLSVRLPVDVAHKLTLAAQAVEIAVARTTVAAVHADQQAGIPLASKGPDTREYKLARALVGDARDTSRAAAAEHHKLCVDPHAGRTAPAASVWVTINKRDNQLADDVGLGDSRYLDSPRAAGGATTRFRRPVQVAGGRDLTPHEAEQMALVGTIRRAIPKGYRLTDQGKVVRRRKRR